MTGRTHGHRAHRAAPRGRRPLEILISAGPTREPLDAVRYISNYSTGYMGARLAAESLRRGHRVRVVRGPMVERLPPGARVAPVDRAAEMATAMHRYAGEADVIIMAAAVSDFRPVRPEPAKLIRRAERTLRLVATDDILANLPRRPSQVVVGFALETGAVLPRARRKLRSKRLDLLLAQRLNGTGAPFGRRRVRAWILGPGDACEDLGRVSKPNASRALLDKIERLWYGQTRRGTHRQPRRP